MECCIDTITTTEKAKSLVPKISKKRIFRKILNSPQIIEEQNVHSTIPVHTVQSVGPDVRRQIETFRIGEIRQRFKSANYPSLMRHSFRQLQWTLFGLLMKSSSAKCHISQAAQSKVCSLRQHPTLTNHKKYRGPRKLKVVHRRHTYQVPYDET